MNKQEAIAFVLERLRAWESPAEEVRAAEPEAVLLEMLGAVSRIDAGAHTSNLMENADLAIVGAAALFFLTDEVTVVAGRSLDEWLAGGEGMGRLIAVASDNPAAYEPVAINGLPPAPSSQVGTAERIRQARERGERT